MYLNFEKHLVPIDHCAVQEIFSMLCKLDPFSPMFEQWTTSWKHCFHFPSPRWRYQKLLRKNTLSSLIMTPSDLNLHFSRSFRIPQITGVYFKLSYDFISFFVWRLVIIVERASNLHYGFVAGCYSTSAGTSVAAWWS